MLLFFFFVLALFSWRRILFYLRFLQQDEYNAHRFFSWLFRYAMFDHKATFSLSLTFVGSFFFPLSSLFLSSAVLLFFSLTSSNPRTTGKVRLSMTPRAKRIAYTAFSLFLCFLISLFFFKNSSLRLLISIALVAAIPFFLIMAAKLLAPIEKRINQRYCDDAGKLLAAISPFVIGITGSYGKTSTKHLLGEILATTSGPTFYPPGGVNTLMGITAALRKGLRPSHRFAVIEMGAYRRGSIKRSCSLTRPKAAIITGIGHCHLERFGSQDEIQKAKGELAESLPSDGILVCNGDDPRARSLAQQHRTETTLLYGFIGDDLDCKISSFTTDRDGTSFTIHWKGTPYEGFVPQFGRTALANVMAAFTMAAALGSDPSFIIATLGILKPVDQRLQVVKTEKSYTIHDGYNSNPVGFVSALEVLGSLPTDRSIILTPGIVEMGEQQSPINYAMGEQIAAFCDYAYIIGNVNREALSSGCLSGGMLKENLLFFSTRDEAFQHLSAHTRSGDGVLIENDLPDIYENERYM